MKIFQAHDHIHYWNIKSYYCIMILIFPLPPPKKKKKRGKEAGIKSIPHVNYCLRHRFFDYHLASHLESKQTVLPLRGQLVLELKLFMMINLHWMQQSSTTLRLHSIPRDSPSINPRTKTSPELHFAIQNNKLLLQRQGFFQRVVSLCLQKASPVNKPRQKETRGNLPFVSSESSICCPKIL